jgi:hypothetical protein
VGYLVLGCCEGKIQLIFHLGTGWSQEVNFTLGKFLTVPIEYLAKPSVNLDVVEK